MAQSVSDIMGILRALLSDALQELSTRETGARALPPGGSANDVSRITYEGILEAINDYEKTRPFFTTRTSEVVRMVQHPDRPSIVSGGPDRVHGLDADSEPP